MWLLFYLIRCIHIRIIDADLDRVSFAIWGWGLNYARQILCFVLVYRCQCDCCFSAYELSPPVSKSYLIDFCRLEAIEFWFRAFVFYLPVGIVEATNGETEGFGVEIDWFSDVLDVENYVCECWFEIGRHFLWIEKARREGWWELEDEDDG